MIRARTIFRPSWHRAWLLAAVFAAAPACADEYTELGEMLRAGRAAEALVRIDRALAARPRDPQLRFLKGVGQSQAGRGAEAMATFTALTQDYPELPEPYNNLGVLHAARAEFDQARSALETAVRLLPGYAVAHENLGDVYAKLAARSYARAQQLDARNAALAPKLTLIQQLFTPRAGAAPVSAVPRPASSLAAATSAF
jgi:tetratricopeptide (TPR) repeat protein